MMGAGKTSIAAALSKNIDLPFVDLDQKIEDTWNRSIADIFDSSGEAVFRRLESMMLKYVLNNSSHLILATGGGTPCFYNNMNIINKTSISIYLKCSPQMLAQRLLTETTQRPLLKKKEISAIEKVLTDILAERADFYQQAMYTVDANGPLDQVVLEVERLCQKHLFV